MKKQIIISQEDGVMTFHTEGFSVIEVIGILTIYKKEVEIEYLKESNIEK